jgi:hypothetical protein
MIKNSMQFIASKRGITNLVNKRVRKSFQKFSKDLLKLLYHSAAKSALLAKLPFYKI